MVNRAAEYLPYGLFGVAILAAILDIALFGGGLLSRFSFGSLSSWSAWVRSMLLWGTRSLPMT
jgi:hypothetical protein